MEEEITQMIKSNETDTLKRICEHLRDYGNIKYLHLAKLVASLCEVDVEEMMSSCKNIDVTHARWLYFYSCRYMTNETYEKIGKSTAEMKGEKYTPAGVASCVNKMYSLIEQQPIWRKRWTIIKRIIKETNGTVIEPPIPITITVPKNVEVTIKKK